MNAKLVDAFIRKYSRLPTETDPDYLEMLRMSKYRILDVPDFNPGKCGNCGASKNDGRKYIDFGLEIDWYGTMYLCGTCLHEVANKVGLFEDLEQERDAALLKIEELETSQVKEEVLPANLVRAWEEFKEYYDSLHTSRDNSSPGAPADLESSTPASKSRVNKTEPRTTKSTASTGRTKFSSLAEIMEQNGE